MTEDEITAFAAALPDVVVHVASAEAGDPEPAWGDTFLFHNPDGVIPRDGRLPFTTIVRSDYPGWDTASDLDRPGVWRLNIAVGRAVFTDLLGYPPAAAADHRSDVDHTAADRILPHPLYAVQGWVAVLNPGPATAARILPLVEGAYARAARRPRRPQ